MRNPIKIIHKFKNNNGRNQYKIYIFLGSLLEERILKILKIIEDKDFITSFTILNDKQIKELEDFYGEKWYNFFFTSFHINSQRNLIKNNNAKKTNFINIFSNKQYVKKIIEYHC